LHAKQQQTGDQNPTYFKKSLKSNLIDTLCLQGFIVVHTAIFMSSNIDLKRKMKLYVKIFVPFAELFFVVRMKLQS